MNRAILVFQVLSYRHFLGLDDGISDSRVLCDHYLSKEYGEDKHLNANFPWEMNKWDKGLTLLFSFSYS